MGNIKSVGIIGGGPCGCSLALQLKRKGYKVAVFYIEKRPEIIVGESLVPAIVPYLRELGIEEEVKSYSTYKPGASVWVDADEESTAAFTCADGTLPHYAYNVPRLKFDKTIFDLAVAEGVTFFKQAASLEYNAQTDEVSLSQETIHSIDNYFNGQPDLIVDASGRSRTISRLINIPAKEGNRKDIAIFAHLSGAESISPFNIHLHRFSKGWFWRIPLPGLVSTGIVIRPDLLKAYGQTKEEQYDNLLKSDEILLKFNANAKRETGVQLYSNYQLISEWLYGKNWILVGDAGGFLDPIFSSGLFLAIKGSFEAVKAIENYSGQSLKKFQKNQVNELKLWQQLVDTWYSGRLFTLIKAGQDRLDTSFGRFVEPYIKRHLTRIFTGEAVYRAYSRAFLAFVLGPMIGMMKMARLHNRNVKDYEIK